jgi:hypothetical protein
MGTCSDRLLEFRYEFTGKTLRGPDASGDMDVKGDSAPCVPRDDPFTALQDCRVLIRGKAAMKSRGIIEKSCRSRTGRNARIAHHTTTMNHYQSEFWISRNKTGCLTCPDSGSGSASEYTG